MLAEKSLEITRQHLRETGCRAADIGLHDHSSAKRVHRAPSLLCARRLLSLRQFLVHWERNENKPAISKAYRMGSILGWQDWSWTIGRTRRGSACSGNLL